MDYSEVSKWTANISRPKKIAVCTAWGSPFCWTMPAYNMANLARPEGVEVLYLPGFGWCPARRHAQGVEEALRWGATHICFLGADQMHPIDILERFADHITNGWGAVCARVPARGWAAKDFYDKPYQETAFKWKLNENGNPTCKNFNQECMEAVKEEDGLLQEIAVIGSGALMFDINIIKGMKKPWFKERLKKDGSYQRLPVMDTFFTYRISTEMNVKILCDLSIKVQHVDVFPIDASYGDKFEDVPKWNLLSTTANTKNEKLIPLS